MDSYVRSFGPTTNVKSKQEMKIADFMKSAGSKDVQNMFQRINGGSYSACHTSFYEATGIWIPELVPIFQKMDAMMVMREGAITPK